MVLERQRQTHNLLREIQSMNVALQQNFRQSAGSLKEEAQSLAKAGGEILYSGWNLIISPSARKDAIKSFTAWLKKNETQRICDRLNDQIRSNFVLSLNKSNFDNSPTSEAATRDYVSYAREYTGGLYKLTRWLSSRPFTSISTLVGGSFAISAFLTPFASFIPILSFVLSKIAEQKTFNKLTKFEQEFKKAGIKTPKYFNINQDGNLTFDGHLVQREGNKFSFVSDDGEEKIPLDAAFSSMSAFPIHYATNPSYVYSVFDATNGRFERSQLISSAGYEAMVRGHNPNLSGGLKTKYIPWVQQHFKNSAEREFIYLSSIIFPQQSLRDHVELLEKTKKETVSFSFGNDERHEIPAHEAIVQSFKQASQFNLSSLSDRVSIDDLKIFARHYEGQTSEQAKAMMIMMGSDKFSEKIPLYKVAEVAANMGQHALHNVDRNGEFPMVIREYVARGLSDWGDVFAYQWQNSRIREQFSYDEVREMAENYLSWGEQAFQIATTNTDRSLSFEQIKEQAQQESIATGIFMSPSLKGSSFGKQTLDPQLV